MRVKPMVLALACAAVPVFAQTPAPPSPETERLVMRHMEMVQKGDLATMLKDMSDPVTLIGQAGPRMFTHAQMLARFSEQFSRPDQIELVSKAFFKNIGYVLYTVNPGKADTHQFSETFFVENGKIVAYTNTQFTSLWKPAAAAAGPSKK